MLRHNDQANGLRALFARRTLRLLGVGGLDATPIVDDLAWALAELGSHVLVIDRTRGELASRLGIKVRWELAHVVAGDRSLAEVLIELPGGIVLLPAARGLDELALIAHAHDGGWQAWLADRLGEAGHETDVWLVNGLPPAGGEADVLLAIEPTSAGMTNAYAQIKALAQCRGHRSFAIAVRADSDEIAHAAFTRVATTVKRFLAADVDYRGSIPGDHDPPPRRQALLRLAETLLVPTPSYS